MCNVILTYIYIDIYQNTLDAGIDCNDDDDDSDHNDDDPPTGSLTKLISILTMIMSVVIMMMMVIVTMARMMMTIIPLQEVQPSWSVFSAPRVREAGVQAAVWGLCQGLKVCRNKSWLLVSTSLWYPFFFFKCNNAPHSRMTVAILSLSWVRLYFWKVSEALPRSKYIDMGWTKTSLWIWRDFLLRRLTFFWMTYSITAGIFFFLFCFLR